MTAGCVLSVSAEVDTHAEAPGACASSFIFLDLRSLLTGHIPDVDLSLVRSRSEEASVFTQSQCPGLARLRRRAITFGLPLARVWVDSPYFDLTTEAGGSSHTAVFGGTSVMTA